MAFVVTGNTVPASIQRSGTRQLSCFEVLCTGAGATSQFSIPVPSLEGAVVLIDAFIESGTGTTLRPALGRETGFDPTVVTDPLLIGQVSAAATRIYEEAPRSYFLVGSRTLWVQPTPNAGSDNKIVVRIVVADGGV